MADAVLRRPGAGRWVELMRCRCVLLSRVAFTGLLAGILGCRLDLSQDHSEDFATSCGHLDKGDPPEVSDQRITVVVGHQAYPLTACFYHDQWRTAEARNTTWEALDPTIVRVHPATGPYTFVDGLRLGVTRVRAVITGVTLYTTVQVCVENDCPDVP